MSGGRRFLVAALAALVVGACGKKGNPLPPLRPVPQRVVDVTAVRTASGITLRFTVPAANLDGTTPAAIDRVDVFGWLGPPGTPPPAAGVIAANPSHLRTTVRVARSPEAGTSPASEDAAVPGKAISVPDRLDAIDPAQFASIAYVVVPVAGTGRGRPGPPSAPAVVSLGALPSAPAGLVLATSETEVRASWQAAAGQSFRVLRTNPMGDDIPDGLVTPAPIGTAEVALPVEFGREVCLVVQALVTTGSATLEGARSRPVCTTPVDTYPPPVPAGLQAVQEGATVAVFWTAVSAPDLAGYIVLRGTGSGDDLQPLMRAPIAETTYRDTTVQPGQTYVYAVYAEDRATPPNVSQLSNRQSVTVR